MRYSDLIKVGVPAGDLQYVTNIPLNGSEFSPDQTVRIALSVPINAFVDLKRAYIKFRINNKDTTHRISLDPSAGCAAVINAMRVYDGSGGLLQEINHYNALYSLMSDLSGSQHYQSSLNMLNGNNETPFTAPVSGVGGTGTGDDTTRVLIAGSASADFVHVPMGEFWNMSRLCPLGFASGISTVELSLASANLPFTFNNTVTSITAWTVSNFELHLPIIKCGEEFNNSFRQMISSGIAINIHSVGYSNSQQNISASSTGTVDLTFSSRKRSVKSLVAIIRKNADLSSLVVDSCGARKSCGISSYAFSVGGVQIPSQRTQITSNDAAGTSVYAQLEMMQGRLGHTQSGTCCNRDNFRAADDVASGSKIAYGVDLQCYDGVQSGKNLSGAGVPIVLNAVLGTGTTNITSGTASGSAASGAALVDLYTQFDCIYTLDGVSGVLSKSE
jgi:hypothetical protein